MSTKFEVQFCNGFGEWRRWSLVSSWDKAHASRLRLRKMLGTESIGVRIVERKGA